MLKALKSSSVLEEPLPVLDPHRLTRFRALKRSSASADSSEAGETLDFPCSLVAAVNANRRLFVEVLLDDMLWFKAIMDM